MQESLSVINYLKLPLKRVDLQNMISCRSGIHMGLMARSFSTGVPTACRLVGGLSLSTHKSLMWQLTAWQKARESATPKRCQNRNWARQKPQLIMNHSMDSPLFSPESFEVSKLSAPATLEGKSLFKDGCPRRDTVGHFTSHVPHRSQKGTPNAHPTGVA